MIEKIFDSKKRNFKGIIALVVALFLICSVTFGVYGIFANEKTGEGLLLSCDFNGDIVDAVSKKDGTAKGVNYYKSNSENKNSLRINNEHRSGNSIMDASSYVEYKGLKNLENSDFTIAFDYYANEPSDIFSTILSTGKFGEGINIFNKQGLGISVGNMVMKADSLSGTELNNGGIRLDKNMLNDEQWHSVLITANRDENLNLYVDGFFRESMNISKIKKSSFVNDALVIGADSDLKFGSEDMMIANLRIYDKVCDKNGHELFDEYAWLVANKKAGNVISDYKGLADDNKLNALDTFIKDTRPSTIEEVEKAVNEANSLIKDVILSASSKKQANFQILSDTHMMTSNLSSKMSLVDALTNIGEWYSDTDALVVTGDLTDNGYDVQYDKFYDAMKKANTAPYTMTITGNHESSYNNTTMAEDNARFLKYENDYRKSIGVETLDKVYFDKWVSGFHFIGLGSEETLADGGHAYLSPEQIQFLKDKLAEKDSSGNYDPDKPIFVFCHQPLTNTTPGSDVYGIGDVAGELTEIFRDYPQIVYVSGHVHNGYVGEEAVYNQGYGTLLDTPCLRANEAVRYRKSIGYDIAVYEGNKIIITPVNFTDDDIMYDMSIVIDRVVRETKTAKYDAKVNEIKLDGITARIDNLTDNHSHTYNVFRANEEIEFIFADMMNIDGLRIETNYWNKPEEIDVSVSADGVTYGEWKNYKLDKATDIQKLFIEKTNIKSIKVRFKTNSNIMMLVPTLAK